MNNKQLCEMIDALRPGSDDLNQPEMAELASHLAQNDQARALRRRIEQTDHRIADAFHEVSVPSGLAERLLTGCEAATSKRDCSPAPAGVVRCGGRRPFVALGVALATAALALLAVGVFKSNDEPLTADVILDSALHFFVEKDVQHIIGQPLRSAPADFPIADRDIRVPPGTLWRRLDALAGNGAMIAYDLTTRRNPVRATLYVLRLSVTGLPGSASARRPDRLTLGSCVTAWQQDGLVYVLAVRGKVSDYQQFLKSSSGTLAMR